ncbi:Transcriptional regulatory protein, C terminal [Micromonospora nigra]|uniref:Transcriptional regulatory protein, C terminal n=1 Tax=Micromonospora nigra TaxID=145857 RepID=A0A1C6RC04_9ACTN|nr:BTAD domain-containing putative transcriptional regulator [Micromonospora nigra]SCL14664.1 Transcriptional regulatory protein, C terminal [Micromonospora nigra]
MTTAEPAIVVRTLGGFAFSAGGHEIDRWRAGKARVLLQFMLLNRGRVLSRETLYEALWPDAPWSRTSSSLKVAVHMLRAALTSQNERAVGAGGPAGERASLRLVTHQLGYALEAEGGVWVDFEVFDDLIDRARAAEAQGDGAQAVRLCASAMEIYRGDFLPGVDLDWAEVHRMWLRSRSLLALERLIAANLASGDHLTVVDRCREMLQIEPYREETYRILIAVHGHLGHLSQAQRWYEICSTRLRRELNVDVDESTNRLHRQAIRGELCRVGLDIVAVLRGRIPVGI